MRIEEYKRISEGIDTWAHHAWEHKWISKEAWTSEEELASSIKGFSGLFDVEAETNGFIY
jgi:hypothetical protein